MVQWLGLHTFTAESPGLIPGRGTKILQAERCGKRKKQETRKKRKKNVLSCSTSGEVIDCDEQSEAVKHVFLGFQVLLASPLSAEHRP